MFPEMIVRVALPVTAVLVLASAAATAAPSLDHHTFGSARPVVIRGYTGDAMEPFVSADGRYLLFNNLNQSPVHTTLRYATRVSGATFRYRGEVRGANDPVALTGVPSLVGGIVYFISTRSYGRTLATVYTGRFTAGTVTHVHLDPGVVAPRFGLVDFDVGVDPSGSELYVSEGQFTAGSAPSRAMLVLFTCRGARFVRDPHSAHVLGALNRPGALTYAASAAAGGREIFFTQVRQPGAMPAIYRATRTRVGLPFGRVQRITAVTGFAEAPSISSDGHVLYYHRQVGARFEIYAVMRR